MSLWAALLMYQGFAALMHLTGPRRGLFDIAEAFCYVLIEALMPATDVIVIAMAYG